LEDVGKFTFNNGGTAHFSQDFLLFRFADAPGIAVLDQNRAAAFDVRMFLQKYEIPSVTAHVENG
jgi:hypothetical protein